MAYKKIIAREFLFLLSTILLLVLIFIGLQPYNKLQERKTNTINDETIIITKNYQTFLSKPLKAKNDNLNQETLNDIVKFYKANPKAELYKQFPQLKNDSAIWDYDATINSGKYKSLKELNLMFPEFFVINKSDLDSLEYYKTKIDILQKAEMKSHQSILTDDDIKNSLLYISIWLFILTFGLRYLYYATKWSLKTIRSK